MFERLAMLKYIKYLLVQIIILESTGGDWREVDFSAVWADTFREAIGGSRKNTVLGI